MASKVPPFSPLGPSFCPFSRRSQFGPELHLVLTAFSTLSPLCSAKNTLSRRPLIGAQQSRHWSGGDRARWCLLTSSRHLILQGFCLISILISQHWKIFTIKKGFLPSKKKKKTLFVGGLRRRAGILTCLLFPMRMVI